MAIFIRDLRLKIDQRSSVASFINEASSSSRGGGGFASIGSIFLGGSASHWSTKGYTDSTYSGKWEDQGYTVKGLQLVGFKCHILPKSPNPDPSIKNWV